MSAPAQPPNHHHTEGEDQPKFPLHEAARDGKIPAVFFLAQLVESLLSSNPKDALKKDDDERLPIHWAASNSHNEVIDLLLQVKGFDIDEIDGSGWTVLHIAASTGNDALMEKLIKRDADVNQKSWPLPIDRSRVS
ncbi:Ankyrin-1 [Arthrobotrys entomopaga]|nr:Ankyrin-1 [Arthrobotrys entomopaga]